MKPKRVGTHTVDYSRVKLDNPKEIHPVYEYRGYFIARNYFVANTPSCTHFEVYDRFENGILSGFSYLNREKGQKRLLEAVWVIDAHLGSELDYSKPDYITRQKQRER